MPRYLYKKVLEGQSNEIRKDVIGCDIVYTSPDRLNIFYAVKERTAIDEDLQFGINDLKINNLEWLCTADPEVYVQLLMPISCSNLAS